MTKQTITEFKTGERIDKAIAIAYPKYSRSSIEKLIDLGDITVNGAAVKTKYKLKTNDTIIVDFSRILKSADSIQLPIIYEDDNVIVINKPIGVLVHSKGDFNKEGTVATWLKEYAGKNNSDFWQSNRAGIVHRLDRATSGVMVCAKNESAQKYLHKQFAKRNVKKSYIAVVSGELPKKNGLIDIPIERNPKKPATFRAGVNGKSAQTNFQAVSTYGSGDESYTLVELQPITGRTHQLRVHMSHLGCPIVGDDIYSGVVAARLMLHADSLEVTLPGGLRKIFKADRPSQFDGWAG